MGRERETAGTVVLELLGGRGDSVVVDYIKNVLEDGEFDYGPDGQDAYDAFGEMMVGTLFGSAAGQPLSPRSGDRGQAG